MSKVRYAWDTPEKSKTLIALLKDTIAKKDSAERRWVTSNDWDAVFEAYNEKLSAQAAPNVLALKNRLALMKMQYKEYHKVIAARKEAGGSLGPEAWQLLIQKHPDVQKWRGVEFPFYDELQDLFRLLGVDDNDLEIKHRKPRVAKASGSPYLGSSSPVSASASTLASALGSTPGGTAVLRHPVLPLNGSLDALSGSTTNLLHSSSSTSVLLRKRESSDYGLDQGPTQRLRRTSGAGLLVNSNANAALGSGTLTAIDEYELALLKLNALHLSIADRVDAKLFLVQTRHSRAFLHMDMEEQREFLFKYCFKPRDTYGRCHLEW